MRENNGIRNEELNSCWELLYNIEEIVRDTPFALDQADMERVKKNIREVDARFYDKSVPIKIVVAGRMKAGKSMMTDVLFFNGEGILNSEATPATANITYIRRIDEEHKEEGAKVYFLKHEDVKQMENYLEGQSEDGNSDDASAIADKIKLQETERLLKKINADPQKRDSLLGKDKWIKRSQLRQYSDAEGEFSAYVDHIELYINDDRLKDLEIADTPGLGDPVASRSQKARDESRTAEVVFYLSRASHFMNMEDADEFARLKKAGCKNMVLIMSQFDEVFEPDEEDEISDLRDTLIYDQLAEEGKKRIKDAMKRNGMEYEPVKIIPICALGVKLSLHKLEEDDAFYRSKMAKIFPDLSDYNAVSELSGIRSLQDERERVASEKVRIRYEFNMEMLQKCQSEVWQIYHSLCKQIEDDIAMKNAILDRPDVANKALRAVNQWKDELEIAIDRAMGEICTKIDTECGTEEGIGKELYDSARAARENMDSATSPDSLNGAYEYVFRNAVDLMFAEGLVKRMRFDDGKEAYGQMFQSFGAVINEVETPDEIKAINGLKNIVYDMLQNIFEARIHERYHRVLKDAVPHENVIDILNDNYETVRSHSSNFKYKSNPWTGRARKNKDAIDGCKKAIDVAAGAIYEPVKTYCCIEIRALFSSIGQNLKSELGNKIKTVANVLCEKDNKNLKEQIELYNNRLAEIKKLEYLGEEKTEMEYVK